MTNHMPAWCHFFFAFLRYGSTGFNPEFSYPRLKLNNTPESDMRSSFAKWPLKNLCKSLKKIPNSFSHFYRMIHQKFLNFSIFNNNNPIFIKSIHPKWTLCPNYFMKNSLKNILMFIHTPKKKHFVQFSSQDFSDFMYRLRW